MAAAPSFKIPHHVVRHGRWQRRDCMNFEIARLMSFHGTRIPASTIRLAQAGFFASHSGTSTTCFCCGVVVKDWGIDDKPFQVHRVKSPCCAHLRGLSNNVQMDESETPASPTIDVSGEVDCEFFRLHPSTLSQQHDYCLRQLHDEVSLSTNLRESGSIVCYHCDQSLRLSPGDDPLQEHSDLFPNCGHVCRMFGKRPRSAEHSVAVTSSRPVTARRRLYSE